MMQRLAPWGPGVWLLLACAALWSAGCAVSSGAPAPAGAPGPEDGWVALFNGRDLSGWTPKIVGEPLGADAAGTFRVEEGLLKVSYAGYESFDGRFGHLFHEGVWSHYRLRVEYRFVGRQLPDAPGWAHRNSGVMIHGQAPETMARDQEFPVSIEVQLLGGGGQGERPTANLCTPGTHVVMDGELVTEHCIRSASQTYHGEGWVTVEIEVRGGEQVTHLVEGRPVLTYERPQLDPGDPEAAALLTPAGPLLTEGSISLQSESHPVEFRRVEIRVLEP